MSVERDRIWVAGRLNREDIPQPVWEALVARFYDGDERRGGVTLEQLAALAKDLLIYEEVMGSVAWLPESNRNGGERSEAEDLAGTYEEERARTLAEYLALTTVLNTEKWPLLSTLYESEAAREVIDGIIQSPEEWRSVADRYRKLREPLYEVMQKAESLSETLLGYWTFGEIVKLVLTGEFRHRAPVEAEINAPVSEHLSYGTITLKVEPWVPTETLVKTYQHHQMLVLRQRTRALSRRNLAVARFVFGRLRETWSKELDRWWSEDADGVSPSGGASWRALVEEWNERHPEDAYEEPRLFRRDFHRAANTVVRPYGTTEKARAGETMNGPDGE
jgi:hypothetical protein